MAIQTSITINILEAIAIGVRAMRLDRDLERMRAHADDGDPAVRRHARDWLRQLETERSVLSRWQTEITGAVL